MERLILPFQTNKNTWADLFELGFYTTPYNNMGDFEKLHTLFRDVNFDFTQLEPYTRNGSYASGGTRMQDRWSAFLKAFDLFLRQGSLVVNPRGAEADSNGEEYLEISNLCVPCGVEMSGKDGDREHHYTGFATTPFTIPTKDNPLRLGDVCQPTVESTMNFGYGVLYWLQQMFFSLNEHLRQQLTYDNVIPYLNLPTGNYGGWMRTDGPFDRADTLWNGSHGQIVSGGTYRFNLDCLWTMQAALGYMVTNFAKSVATWHFKNETRTRRTKYQIMRDGTILDHRTEQEETVTASYDDEMRWSRSVRMTRQGPATFVFDPAYICGEILFSELGIPESLTEDEVAERTDVIWNGDAIKVPFDLSQKNWRFSYLDEYGNTIQMPGMDCGDDEITVAEVVERATMCLGVVDDEYDTTHRTEWRHAAWWPMKDLMDRGFIKGEQLVLAERLKDYARWMYKYEGPDEHGNTVREWRATIPGVDISSPKDYYFRVHKVTAQGDVEQNTPNQMLKQVADEVIEWVRQHVGGNTDWMPESFEIKTSPALIVDADYNNMDLVGDFRRRMSNVRALYDLSEGVYEFRGLTYYLIDGAYDYGWVDLTIDGNMIRHIKWVGGTNYKMLGPGVDVPEFDDDNLTIKPSTDVMVGVDWDFKCMPCTVG